jgi:hypothetical protein
MDGLDAIMFNSGSAFFAQDETLYLVGVFKACLQLAGK